MPARATGNTSGPSAPGFPWFRVAATFVALGALAITPFGGWLQSFFYGTGVRWHEAYSALESAETNLPRDERERERLLIASARVESEPPIGMKVGPRLHPVGTLARLHYETLDERGERLSGWDVRALVPRLADDEDPFWRERCNRSCKEEIERGEGISIRRSGDPGFAQEWVLRMPLEKTFEITPGALRTQDILDSAPRRIVLRYVRAGDRPALRPAKIRVTLVEACPATVRVGTTLNLEIYPNAIVPIPSGFSTSRWVKVDGCGKLAPLPPPIAKEEPLTHAKPEIAEAPELHSIIVRREPATGHANLIVDEGWLQKHNMPVVFQVAKICRYDARANQWQRLPAPAASSSSRLLPLPSSDASASARVAFELPRETGLFWVYWSEQNEGNRSARSTPWHDALVVSGRVLCNDVDLAPATGDGIAACVPFADHAEARHVPAPAAACGS